MLALPERFLECFRLHYFGQYDGPPDGQFLSYRLTRGPGPRTSCPQCHSHGVVRAMSGCEGRRGREVVNLWGREKSSIQQCI